VREAVMLEKLRAHREAQLDPIFSIESSEFRPQKRAERLAGKYSPATRE
jgi:hypothetical protein